MKANQIKNQIENQLQNQLATFSMLNSALPAISQIAQTLTDLLPQPQKLSFYAPHNWALDSAHGGRNHLPYPGYLLPGIRPGLRNSHNRKTQLRT